MEFKINMPNENPDFPDTPKDLLQQTGEYDHLFEAGTEAVITEEERASWPELKPYQKDWFAPHMPPEYTGSQEGDGGRRPTPERESDAVRRLTIEALDSKIEAIIHEFIPPGATAEETVAAIRQIAGLREELARYFLSKISKTPLAVPHRVAVNTIKDPNHTGYPARMYSRDYAALLAISKLDGTYDERLSAEKGSLPQYDWETREYITGQHQAAADFLLSSNRSVIRR